MLTLAAILIIIAAVLSVVAGAVLALLELLLKRISREQERGAWGESWGK